MSDQPRSDDPDAQRLPADDRALGNLLRRQEKKLAKLERNQIGCNMQCTPIVVVNKPPKNPQCGVCYILSGTSQCMPAPPGCEDEEDCRGCLPDVMGSSRWEFTAPDPGSHGPLAYDATGEFYYATATRIQTLIWPDLFTGPQSISVAAKNFATVDDVDASDWVTLELRRRNNFIYDDGLRVVVQAWAAGTDFFGEPYPAGWYWWIEWYDDADGSGDGTYIYQYYCDEDPSFDGSVVPWSTATEWEDDFERADGAIGSNWAIANVGDWNQDPTGLPFTISGGAAIAPAQYTIPYKRATTMRWTGEQADDQSIEVEVENFVDNNGVVNLYTNTNTTDAACMGLFVHMPDGETDLTFYISNFDAAGAPTFLSSLTKAGPIVEPFRVRFESRADGTQTIYYNGEELFSTVDSTPRVGPYVAMGIWIFAYLGSPYDSPRILSAGSGATGALIHLESDVDGSFRWLLNGEVMHEGSVPTGVYLTDPSKVGLWTDLVSSGAGVVVPSIEITPHIHDICINGSADCAPGVMTALVGVFETSTWPMGQWATIYGIDETGYATLASYSRTDPPETNYAYRIESDTATGAVRAYINGDLVCSGTDTGEGHKGPWQAMELGWDFQFATHPDPPGHTPPRILNATGGSTAAPWTDQLNDAVAWVHNAAIFETTSQSEPFDVVSGAFTGPSRYQHWIPDAYTSSAASDRIDAVPGPTQFCQATIADLWQHYDPDGPNPDANQRTRLILASALQRPLAATPTYDEWINDLGQMRAGFTGGPSLRPEMRRELAWPR